LDDFLAGNGELKFETIVNDLFLRLGDLDGLFETNVELLIGNHVGDEVLLMHVLVVFGVVSGSEGTDDELV
jgi:hypothetical protein